MVQDWGFSTNDTNLSSPRHDVSSQVITDTNGLSVISLTINGSTSSTVGRITITGDATVDSSVAQPGDVLVTYYRTNLGVVGASLTVAKYAASGVATPQGTTSNVIAGRQNQQVGQFLLPGANSR